MPVRISTREEMEEQALRNFLCIWFEGKGLCLVFVGREWEPGSPGVISQSPGPP
jgi:hypothetical protein